MEQLSNLVNVIYTNVINLNISIWTFYFIAFVWLSLDSMGLPLPYEGMLLITGALVGAGFINPLESVILTIFSTVFGACLSFLIGTRLKFFTSKLSAKYKNILDRILYLIEGEKGFIILIIVRFLPGIRHFSSYIAGISRVDLKNFLLPTTIGSSVWSIFVLIVGFSGIESIKMFKENSLLASLILVITITLFGYIYFSLHKHSKRILKVKKGEVYEKETIN
ncbi:SNARE associated Golgi protein-like protein [Thermodesulfobium narugense DSM 14796]|uniref:SNARE associated Golgi protein-like protein n=1 Tax=Thermodesulfobium narugense DSM 14796 TaxID=747365 RepID=M1E8S6_9BACT|nr:DedA family protein [Thermodesulfobium narugense]AEE15135.1 SNARE associated Golgi protein-like protein [Thermodesulfobium narugense DSM 14796]